MCMLFLRRGEALRLRGLCKERFCFVCVEMLDDPCCDAHFNSLSVSSESAGISSGGCLEVGG